MSLKHPKSKAGRKKGDVSVQPLFTLEGDKIPRNKLRKGEVAPDVA